MELHIAYLNGLESLILKEKLKETLKISRDFKKADDIFQKVLDLELANKELQAEISAEKSFGGWKKRAIDCSLTNKQLTSANSLLSAKLEKAVEQRDSWLSLNKHDYKFISSLIAEENSKLASVVPEVKNV